MVLRSDGTITAWGQNGLTNLDKTYFNNVLAVSLNSSIGAALVLNTRPIALDQKPSMIANSSVSIQLKGIDADHDPLTFRITSLPNDGALYQYNSGGPGNPILVPNTPVTDHLGRVIFIAQSGEYRVPYTTFMFDVYDGITNSQPATVTVRVPGAPFVFTASATSVTRSNATLNGIVTPNSFPTDVWFEWGTNANYGNKTLAWRLAPNSGIFPLGVPIRQPDPGQVYHFRMVATNAVGRADGGDQIFGLGRKIVAWGDNYFGQTNTPDATTGISAIAAGGYHGLALKENGTVVAWGRNYSQETSVPPGLTNVVKIAAGDGVSFALQNDGRVIGWGWDSESLAIGATNAMAISAGPGGVLCLLSNGTVMAWGPSSSPVTSVPPDLINVVDVSMGASHALALQNDGTVVAREGFDGRPTYCRARSCPGYRRWKLPVLCVARGRCFGPVGGPGFHPSTGAARCDCGRFS